MIPFQLARVHYATYLHPEKMYSVKNLSNKTLVVPSFPPKLHSTYQLFKMCFETILKITDHKHKRILFKIASY